MSNWKQHLNHDPIPPLLTSKNRAINYYTKRDLQGKKVETLEIKKIPQVCKLLQKQKNDGSWKPSKNTGYPLDSKVLVETFKNIRILVRNYKLTKNCIEVEKAADYLFRWQTKAGDFRGFIGDQYAPYYTGEVLAVLCLANYTEDKRVHKGIEWLLPMRQNDGGWTVPMLTHKLDRKTSYQATSKPWKTYEPIRDMPFSHNWTDMALRAFAVHPKYKNCSEAIHAANLLKSRFFQPDVYGSYRDPGYWIRFRFWWSNIVTSLDSLSLMKFPLEDPDVKIVVDWLVSNQMPDGLWKTSYKNGDKRKDSLREREQEEWLTYKICEILKRLL